MTETKIALALGGNIGDVSQTFLNAAEWLGRSGMGSVKMSSFYKTAPVGCEPGAPDFLNAALIGVWQDSPEELLELCRSLEERAGRPSAHERNVARTLDIDIVLFGDLMQDNLELTIPHKDATGRLFVLQPLAEIAPDWIFPDTLLSVAGHLKKLQQFF